MLSKAATIARQRRASQISGDLQRTDHRNPACDDADHSTQPGGVALTDGAKLPTVGVAVELAEDHRRLTAGFRLQGVARYLNTVRVVEQPDVSAAQRLERLPSLGRVVDRQPEEQSGDVARNCGEGDDNLFSVADDRSFRRMGGDGFLRVRYLVGEQQAACRRVGSDHADQPVEFDGDSTRRGAPAESDPDLLDAGRLVLQKQIRALGQGDRHKSRSERRNLASRKRAWIASWAASPV